MDSERIKADGPMVSASDNRPPFHCLVPVPPKDMSVTLLWLHTLDSRKDRLKERRLVQVSRRPKKITVC